jgi:L-ascorbate metabolism protein UlaG (beta-lactamase superfamily)
MKIRCFNLIALIAIGFLSNCTCPTDPDPDSNPDPLPLQDAKLEQIKNILLIAPPNSGDPGIREFIIMELDEILLANSSRDEDRVFEFYDYMMQKVNSELKEEVTEGIRIWLMYNHGFIIKTPETVFAFDLVDGYSGWQEDRNYQLPEDIINSIDALFISHEHVDHTDPTIIEQVRNNGGHVINTDETQHMVINGCQVKLHYGLHSVVNRIFEVTTENGYKIVHTGDNQTSEALPDIDNVDVLLLNAWVNESGTEYTSTGIRNCIYKLEPAVTIPGHIHELWHDTEKRTRFKWSFYVANGTYIPSTIYVMVWGEMYDFRK